MALNRATMCVVCVAAWSVSTAQGAVPPWAVRDQDGNLPPMVTCAGWSKPGATSGTLREHWSPPAPGGIEHGPAEPGTNWNGNVAGGLEVQYTPPAGGNFGYTTFTVTLPNFVDNYGEKNIFVEFRTYGLFHLEPVQRSLRWFDGAQTWQRSDLALTSRTVGQDLYYTSVQGDNAWWTIRPDPDSEVFKFVMTNFPDQPVWWGLQGFNIYTISVPAPASAALLVGVLPVMMRRRRA